MKNRREFLATTIPAAALLTTSSGENRASVAGRSAEAEGRRKSTVMNHSMPEGRDRLIRRKIRELEEHASPAQNK
jgi:hypothetical protein